MKSNKNVIITNYVYNDFYNEDNYILYNTFDSVTTHGFITYSTFLAHLSVIIHFHSSSKQGQSSTKANSNDYC